MKSATHCLQTSDIEAMLAGTALASQNELWEEHLSTCESCRRAMARQIGDQQWWHEAEQSLQHHVGESLRDSQDPKRFFARNAEGSELHESDQRESIEDLIKLLGPTDDPQMLGRIGSYEVLGVLGRGGMGVVFKAFDAPLNRFVAIKMLLPHLAASGAARKRFAREGQAVAAVVDDHVMAIHCVDEWQGVPYLVMTYSRGVSLQKRLSDNGPLEVREILRIGMQAAKGLAAAHAQGIVHRDIKPANIFLDQTVERVQLMDFGLARAVDDASLTRTGVLAGTPQYMSPEQARAEKVDHRSDLFSLGSVMYAMCTGHAPFRAESSYSVLRLITDKEPRPIREINPDVPEWLCAIIGKLIAKQAGERFGSAKEVAGLLEDCLSHLNAPLENSLPRIASHFPKPRRWLSIMNDKRMLSLLGILLLVAAIILPWPIAAVARVWQPAIFFAGSSLLLAMFFAVLSRKEYFSQLCLTVTGVLFIAVLLLQFQRLTSGQIESITQVPSTERPPNLVEVANPIQTSQDGAVPKDSPAVKQSEVFRATVVNVEHSQPLFGVWTVEKIISAGEVVPADKAPGEIEFRGNQMIWKRKGKIRGADRVFDFDLDTSKSPHWFTFRSQDPKRPQSVLALLETTGRYQQPPESGNPPSDEQLPQLRIFSLRDANGNPLTERPLQMGTGEEPGTDLIVLRLKSPFIDSMEVYPIGDAISDSLFVDIPTINAESPASEMVKAKIAAEADLLVKQIEKSFGPCNLIDFDPSSMSLIIDHNASAHEKISNFLQLRAPSAKQPIRLSVLGVSSEWMADEHQDQFQRWFETAKTLSPEEVANVREWQSTFLPTVSDDVQITSARPQTLIPKHSQIPVTIMARHLAQPDAEVGMLQVRLDMPGTDGSRTSVVGSLPLVGSGSGLVLHQLGSDNFFWLVVPEAQSTAEEGVRNLTDESNFDSEPAFPLRTDAAAQSTDRQLGTVLGKPIHESDFNKNTSTRDNLIRLVLQPLTEDYCQKNGLGKINEINERIKDEKSRRIASMDVFQWELQRHLYEKHGGRVLVLAFGGGYLAFDGMRKWLDEREQAGDFEITDSQLKTILKEFYNHAPPNTGFAMPDQLETAFDPANVDWLIEAYAKNPAGD